MLCWNIRSEICNDKKGSVAFFFVQYVISVGDVYLISLPHTITNLPRKSVDK